MSALMQNKMFEHDNHVNRLIDEKLTQEVKVDYIHRLDKILNTKSISGVEIYSEPIMYRLDVSSNIREDNPSRTTTIHDCGVIDKLDLYCTIESWLYTIRQEKDRRVLLLHLGIVGPQRVTYAQIGRMLGLSRERIRQLYNRGYMQLAESFASHPICQVFDCDVFKLIEKLGPRFTQADLHTLLEKHIEFGIYNPIPLIKLLSDYSENKLIFRNIICENHCIEATGLPPNCAMEHIDENQIRCWFDYLSEKEIDLLNAKYSLGLEICDIRKDTVQIGKLEYWTDIYDYLKTSQVSKTIKTTYLNLVENLFSNNYLVEEDAMTKAAMHYFGLRSLDGNKLMKLLSKLYGKVYYDEEHYVWLRKGTSYQDMIDENSINIDNQKILGRMSHTDAAYMILLEAKIPLHYDEIMKIALKRELVITRSHTPGPGLNTQLYLERKRLKQYRMPQRFDALSNGVWGLAKNHQNFAPIRSACLTHSDDNIHRVNSTLPPIDLQIVPDLSYLYQRHIDYDFLAD